MGWKMRVVSRWWSGFLFALISTLLCLQQAGCCPGNARQPGEIVMGFVPSEDAELVTVEMQKLTDILERKTGIPIRPVISSNYDVLVAAMRTGAVQFAWLPPFAYVQAEDEGVAHVLLKAVRQGNPWYYGAIIVRADSPYHKIEDLRGKTIAWGDIKSFSGHIYPKSEIIKMGIDPDKFFGAQRFLMNHPAVVVAVFNNQVDAGAVFSNNTDGNNGAWTQLLRDPKDQAQIRVLLYTPPIPGDTVSVSTQYFAEHPDRTQKIMNAILHLNEDPEGNRILMTIYHIEAMVLAKPEDFQVVRQAAQLVLAE
jgi:phosphonate transport system substrate-binding protein